MLDSYIHSLETNFLKMEYRVELNPVISGVNCLIYCQSVQPIKLGFSKVEDHFIFVDWESEAFSRIQVLDDIHQKISKYVNQKYSTPHVWRIRIPNIAVIALSETPFSPDAINYVYNTYKIPWQMGETGQFMLIDTEEKTLYTHAKPRNKQTGSLPLLHAVQVIQSIM